MSTVIAALGALGALVFTGTTVRATQQQVAIAEQGQLTDRYAKAVEQIGQQGTDHLQIRLGGIYALERLARDSPRDQSTIIEVLSAFIRTTLPTPDDTGTCPKQALPADTEAALTVLGRRNRAHDGTARTDVHDTCLASANLNGADLNGAKLTGANLADANLMYANLTGANLSHADHDEHTIVTGVKTDSRTQGAWW